MLARAALYAYAVLLALSLLLEQPPPAGDRALSGRRGVRTW